MRVFINLSKYTPRGLFARSLLIIVLPIALMQILITYIFFDIHWSQVSKALSETTAGDIAYVTHSYIKNPEKFEELKQSSEADLRLSIAFKPNEKLPQTNRFATIKAYDRSIDRALSVFLKHPYWFDTTRYKEYIEIRVEVNGGILRFLAFRNRVFSSTGEIFLLWVVGTSVLLTIVAVLFIRNQVRPMERLADAAERFGRGESVELRPQGSREVRRAALAFLDMRSRITRHIEQRTNILAGVSHDLRTPLTRLKLELAMLPKSIDTNAARDDIKQMEEMLEEYLIFARGQWNEESESILLNEIAFNCFEDAKRNNKNISITGQEIPLNSIGRSSSLSRCIMNLIQNGLSYGTNVNIICANDKYSNFIHIDDDGPGIAPENYETALSPFSRLDNARNQNKKGVGLGLSIARDIARTHGGEINLSQSPIGGLRVTLRIPKSE